MHGKIIHIAPGGAEHDVSDAVAAMYDLVIGSMDWGSGFWSVEDAVPVGILARLCKFETAEDVEKYLGNRDKWQKFMDDQYAGIADV